MASAGELPALITLPVSHYAEKARWALQRYCIDFTEEAHAPGPHRAAVKAAGGKGSVPCLRLPREAGPAPAAGSSPQPGFVDGSTPILRWADQQTAAAAAAAGRPPPLPLFPAGAVGEEVAALCKGFDDRLGPATRVWAYSHLLYTPSIAAAMAHPSVPLRERLVLRLGGWWMLRPLMVKGLRITPENGEACLGTIRRVFDSVAARLADGRRYLAGDAFTAADLTFACLAAPALAQPYNGATPGLDSPDIPPAMREQVQALRAHPAGRFALRLWAEERGVRVAQGQGAAEEAARPPARM